MRARALIMLGCSALATSSPAAETVGYTYDARGRLAGVCHSGSVNNGVDTSYSYDKTDNRTTVTTAAGGGCGGGGGSPPSFAISDASVTEGGTLVPPTAPPPTPMTSRTA